MNNTYKNPWEYNLEIIETPHSNCVGFVYLITNKLNNRKYIGKKNFWKKLKRKPLKGKKRKRITIVQSDWKQYYGSSPSLKIDIEKFGEENFKREILRFCFSKGELTYKEMEEQIKREVLLKSEYYNEYIKVQSHSKFLKSICYD